MAHMIVSSEMVDRVAFLKDFLGALGAQDLRISQVSAQAVIGTVIYNSTDSTETQDFCWNSRASDVPEVRACKLLSLIRRHQLLDIDRLTSSREELYELFKTQCDDLTLAVFSETLEQLKSIRVRMVDNGRETDTFRIHE